MCGLPSSHLGAHYLLTCIDNLSRCYLSLFSLVFRRTSVTRDWLEPSLALQFTQSWYHFILLIWAFSSFYVFSTIDSLYQWKWINQRDPSLFGGHAVWISRVVRHSRLLHRCRRARCPRARGGAQRWLGHTERRGPEAARHDSRPRGDIWPFFTGRRWGQRSLSCPAVPFRSRCTQTKSTKPWASGLNDFIPSLSFFSRMVPWISWVIFYFYSCSGLFFFFSFTCLDKHFYSLPFPFAWVQAHEQ